MMDRKFNIGDVVRIVKLDEFDKSDTNLIIGDIGVVKYIDGVIFVDFGRDISVGKYSANFEPDGTYQMSFHQLEVVNPTIEESVYEAVGVMSVMFSELLEEGFERAEALQIILKMMSMSIE